MNEQLNLNNLSAGVKIGAIVLGAVSQFFAPLWPFLAMIFILVIADTITGRWRAKVAGKELTPEKEGKVIKKLCLYPLAILLSEGMVRVFFKDISVVEGITYAVALYICSLEFRSNMRNIGEATGSDIWSEVAAWFTARGKKVE